MRMNYLGAALVAALSFSNPAKATNWELVSKSYDNSSSAYVDTDRIVSGSTSRGGWVKLTKSNGSFYISLIAVRCDSYTFWEMKTVLYEKDGSNTDIDPSTKWQIAIPDTLMYSTITRICQ